MSDARRDEKSMVEQVGDAIRQIVEALKEWVAPPPALVPVRSQRRRR